MEQGILFRAEDSVFKYMGWPTVAKDENGVIYVVCSGHRLGHICPFGKNYMFKSYDNAKSWEGPIIVNDSPFDDRDAGIVPLGDNKMLLTYFINDLSVYTSRYGRVTKYIQDEDVGLWIAGIERWKKIPEEQRLVGSFVKVLSDDGSTLVDNVLVPISSPHGPALLKDGRLLYLGTVSGEKEIAAYDSIDGGKTWNHLYTLDKIDEKGDILLCEPYQIELDDGTILGIIRVHKDPDAHKFCMYKSFSYDGGKTWTTPEDMGIKGSPPHVMKHSSGALVLTYTIRDERYGQRARLSYDGGKTWGEEIVLCENAKNWDSGYCSSVELDDGSIYTVYYQKANDDKFCSLMYTKWNIK